MKYAGLATQFLLAIGIAVYAGLKLDEWLKLKTPLAVWILPLLIITGMIIKIVKDTAPKK
ncbi:MAG: AtpZ/AtpI family protein [Ferruginibacter sp.]|nr:AtpZ/AtpI family protein [Ferruginibacter sp.]